MEEKFSKDDLPDFCKEMFQYLYFYGLTYCMNSETVKDCVQETLIIICKKDDLPNTKLHMRNIAKKILRNLLLNEKNRNPVHCTIDEIPHNSFLELSVEDQFIAEEDIQQLNSFLQEALKCLPPQERKLIILYYFEQYSYVEISQLLKMNYQSALNGVHRSLARLRKYFDKHYPEFSLNYQ